MAFVYHGVPRNMVDEVLYPLNQLAYESQKSKYVGREAALEFRVPGIDLLLGDTLHCTAVHPYPAPLSLVVT